MERLSRLALAEPKKYVPIDPVFGSRVIASEAKQYDVKHHDPLLRIRLLRRRAPTRLSSSQACNDSISDRFLTTAIRWARFQISGI
jgi:hypothetical protein